MIDGSNGHNNQNGQAGIQKEGPVDVKASCQSHFWVSMHLLRRVLVNWDFRTSSMPSWWGERVLTLRARERRAQLSLRLPPERSLHLPSKKPFHSSRSLDRQMAYFGPAMQLASRAVGNFSSRISRLCAQPSLPLLNALVRPSIHHTQNLATGGIRAATTTTQRSLASAYTRRVTVGASTCHKFSSRNLTLSSPLQLPQESTGTYIIAHFF
mgnify:CR=1 FL=1